MNPARSLLAVTAVLLSSVACGNEGIPPAAPSIVAGATSTRAALQSEPIVLNHVAAATAEDVGPQDGVFDAFVQSSVGIVNNNGFWNNRTAFEFDLSNIPANATVTHARLTIVLSVFEGGRGVQWFKYPGDGAMQLEDFSAGFRVAAATIYPEADDNVTVDVTRDVLAARAKGGRYLGFNLREDPPNGSNFTVMFVTLTNSPQLSVWTR